MSIEIEEGSDVKEKFRSVGVNAPESGVSVVPSGVTELDSREVVVFPDDSETIRKLVEQSGIEYNSVEDDDTSTLVLHSEEIIIPSLYFAYCVVRDNWDQITYALEKISDFYSRRVDQDVEMVIEQETSDGETIRLTYKGPAEGIESLSEEMASIVDAEVENERES